MAINEIKRNSYQVLYVSIYAHSKLLFSFLTKTTDIKMAKKMVENMFNMNDNKTAKASYKSNGFHLLKFLHRSTRGSRGRAPGTACTRRPTPRSSPRSRLINDFLLNIPSPQTDAED